MKRLLLLTGETPDAFLRWWMGEEGGRAESGTVEGLPALPDRLLAADHIAIILPGEHAATRRLALPVKRDAALEAAARLAFEDVLAAPAEGFHFAFGPVDGEARRDVSAVPLDWMEGWSEAISAAGVEPDLVTLDHLAIRGENGRGVILQEGDRVVIRLPEGGVTMSAEFAAALAPSLEGADKALHVSVGRNDSAALVLADNRALGSFYASAIDREAPASLLRGIYRRRQDWSGLIRQWRNVAALAAACIALWLGGMMADGMRHGAAARKIENEATRLFTEAFPGTPVRDLSRQAAARAQVSGTPMFLPLSAELTAAMEDMVSVEVTALSYQAGQGLVADLRFPDAASLESLRGKLEVRGIATREDGNIRREEDGRWAGQLLLEGLL